MLQIATQGDHWSGDKLELNMSFDTLRDYQWKRLTKALWEITGITGPYETRYIPGQPEPEKSEIRVPEPTATYSEFGAFEFVSGVRVGIEILITRSLFECVSVVVPLKMFENITPTREDTGLLELERVFYTIGITVYQTATFSLATIGINQGCLLLLELLTDTASRDNFIKTGNFLARDDALAALKVQPRLYKEVMPTLRWCPAGNKK